jgi:hypothetical protein
MSVPIKRELRLVDPDSPEPALDARARLGLEDELDRLENARRPRKDVWRVDAVFVGSCLMAMAILVALFKFWH